MSATNRGIVRSWLRTTATERQHISNLNAARDEAELREVMVAGVGFVHKRATLETAQVNLIRQEAERAVPEAAEPMALLAVSSVVKMASIIDDMYRPGYGR